MKTIKERAKAARDIYTSEDTPQYDEWADGCQAGQAYGFLDGYIKGATEQKAIDIERMIAYVEDMPQDVSRQDIIDGIIRAMEE